MRLKLIAAFLLGCLGTAPAAQGLTIDGHFGLGVSTAGDGRIAPVDVIVDIPLRRRALPGGLGLGIGAFGYVLPGKRPHETYVNLSFGGWRAGVVRPSYDSVLASAFEESAPFLAYQQAETTRAYTTTRAMRVNAVPVGLSYQRTRPLADGARLWWGASLHQDTKGGFSSATLAGHWQDGTWQLAAATELVRAKTGAVAFNAKLGGRWATDRWDAGLTLFLPGASGRPDTASVDLSWQMTDRLRLSVIAEQGRHGNGRARGIAGRWAFSRKLSVSASATRRAGTDTLHLTLNRRY